MTSGAPGQTVVNIAENKAMDINSNLHKVILFVCTSWKAVLAEFVSTFLLLLLGCMSCVPIDGFTVQPPMYGAFGFGLIVLMNVQIFGPISGAHMNPSVTLLAVYKGITSIPLGVAYLLAQCTGAVLGYGTLVLVAPYDGMCVTQPHPNLNEAQAIVVEAFLTAGLALACCSAWDPVNKDNQDSMSIKFGLVVTALSIVGGPITGASMNPARSLGPAVWTGTWAAHWVYWVGPLIGCTLAPIIYRLLSTKEEEPKSK